MKNSFLKQKQMASTQPIMKIQTVPTMPSSACSGMIRMTTWRNAVQNGCTEMA